MKENIIKAEKGEGIPHYLYLIEGAIKGIQNDKLKEMINEEYERRRKYIFNIPDLIPLVESLLEIAYEHPNLSNNERLNRFTDITKTFASLPKFGDNNRK